MTDRIRPRGNLRSLVRRYMDGNKNSYTSGDWSIAKGGYDCWFEIYLDNPYFIGCVGGKLSGVSHPLHYSFDYSYKEADKYLEKCLKVVQEESPHTYIEED